MDAEHGRLARSRDTRDAGRPMTVPRCFAFLFLLSLTPAIPAAAWQDDDVDAERWMAEHLEVCDLDGNGWISYREAATTLGIDKAEFRAYDENGDGRIDRAEFEANAERILVRLGAVPGPQPRAGPTSARGARSPDPVPSRPAAAVPPSRATSAALLRAHDRDKSGGLNRQEIETLLRRLGSSLSPSVILDRMDRNGSGELDEPELGALALLATRLVVGPQPSLEAAGPPPPARRSPVPVGNFRRLDRDRDGYIDADDLRGLLAPARVGVRPSTVVAALDRDGDGRLDEAEFLGSMQGP